MKRVLCFLLPVLAFCALWLCVLMPLPSIASNESLPGPSPPLEQVTLQLRWFHQFQFAGYYAALEKGFYRKAGLDVVILERDGKQDVVDVVASGQAHFGATNSELLLHALQGKPLVALAAIFQHSPLVMVARSGINSPHDLIGKKVKMTRHSRDVELHTMFANEGVSLDLLRFTDGEVGKEDYLNPDIDALSAYASNEPYYLERLGKAYTLLRPRHYGVDFYGDTLFTSRLVAESRPDLVQSFMRASLEGWEYAMEHPEEIIDLILERYAPQKSREHLRFEAERLRELMVPEFVKIGHMNPGRWRYIASVFARFGFVDAAAVTDDFFRTFIHDPTTPAFDPRKLHRWIWGLAAALAVVGSAAIILVLFLRQKMRFIAERKVIEDALAEAKHRLELILDTVPAMIWQKDRNGVYLMVNKTYCRTVGKFEAEVIGRKDHDFFPRDIADKYVGDDQKNLESGGSETGIEERHLMPSGEYGWSRTSKMVYRDAGGNISGTIGFALDITEQMRTLEALRRSEERYRSVVNDSPLMICRFFPDFTITYANSAYCRYFRKTEEELLGTPFLALVPEQDHEHILKNIHALTPEAPIQSTTHRVNVADGVIRWHRWSNRALFDDHGAILGYQSIGEDITEFKLALDELRIKDQAMAASMDAIALTDMSGVHTYVNPAFLELWGYEREDEVLGRNVREFAENEQDARHAVASLLQEGRMTGEMVIRRKDGRLVDVFLSATLVRNEQGEPVRMMGLFRDITRQLEEQRLLLRARCQAEAATLAKSEFLANMSHEIRTPMNGVIGMTGLLLDLDLTAEQRRYAEDIQASGEALLSLLNDILDFSKIEAGRLEMECLEFDLHHLLDDFAANMAIRAHEKGLEFICYAEPDVPHLFCGDPGRLRQILSNLAGNAVKFTQQGEVVVRVSCVDQGAGDEERGREQGTMLLRFSIRDTGIGIPQDKIPVIFEKFSQVDSSTTRQFGGTGLGLAISRQLAGMMGGDIGVISEPGRGSEFWFTVRLDVVMGGGERTEPEALQDLQGVRVLVVEGNAAGREILMKQLASWRMRPEEAQGGTSALALLDKAHQDADPFELVLVDMRMPGMDGVELNRIIKGDPRFQGIPLIMLTSLGQPGDAVKLAELGFAAYLNKPVRRSELYDTLVTVLNDLRTGAPHSPPGRIITRHVARERARRKTVLPCLSGRVLVAEDSPVNQIVALGILKKLGLKGDVAANGVEVIDALTRRSYDLVLMDVQMPKMDGLEATRRIRNLERQVESSKLEFEGSKPEDEQERPGRRVPIIAMTAGAMQKDKDSCLEAGMDDYVAKPVNPVELGRVLEKWLPASNDRDSHDHDSHDRDSHDRDPHDFQTSRPSPASQSHHAILEPSEQAPPTHEQRSSFDKVELLRRFAGDEDMVRNTLHMFLVTVPDRIEALEAHMAAKDGRAAVREAHSIKGAAMTLACSALAHTARAMESAAADEDWAALNDLHAQMKRQWECIKSEIDARD